MGARIGGNLECRGGQFEATNEAALLFDRAQIQGTVFLSHKFHATGTVHLRGARIGSDFFGTDGQFDGAENSSLALEGAVVGGNVFLNGGFKAVGEVGLTGARIGGSLECSDSNIEAGIGPALSGDGVQISGTVSLADGFHAKGEVRFLGAEIGGNFDCARGRFEVGTSSEHARDVVAGGAALACDRIKIGGNVFLVDGFHATGDVRFLNAHIAGDFNCNAARFDGPNGGSLILQHAEIGDGLMFWGVEGRTNISLAGARVKSLSDHDLAWQNVQHAVLDGFQYERIFGEAAPTGAAARIAWLNKQPISHLGLQFKPQPWEQLIRVLREMGHGSDADQVAIAKQRMLRTAGKVAGIKGVLHDVFGILVGYGYEPLRLVGYAMMVWFVCSLVYSHAAQDAVFAPTSALIFDNPKYQSCRPEQFGNWATCPMTPYEYTTFNPWIYSLALIIPVIDLQQEKDWAPMVTEPCASPGATCLRSSRSAFVVGEPLALPRPGYWPLGVAVWTLTWLEMLFGWIAGLLFVAVISGLVKKD